MKVDRVVLCRCRLLLTRWLHAAAPASTEAATAATQPRRDGRLYKRLSLLRATGETATLVLNEYIGVDGRSVRKHELDQCIRQLRKYGRYQDALEIMEWMEMKGIKLFSSDHAIRLDLISKCHGIIAAENYFNGLSPPAKNQFTYGSLLNCYCRHQMEDKALALFQKLDELKLPSPSPLAFNNVMSLHLKLGHPEKVPPLIQEMRRRKIPLSKFSYNILMQSYSKQDDIDGVERVFEEMKKENEKHCDWESYSSLAAIYVKAGIHDKADSVLKTLEEKMDRRERSGYHYLISLYAGISNAPEVHRVWRLLKSVFPTTNNLSYLGMLQALAKLNEVSSLRKCFEEWESGCSSYDARLANVAVKAYLKNGLTEEAESVLRRGMKRSKQSFSRAWEMLVQYYLEQRRPNSALKCMEEAISGLKDNKWDLSPASVKLFLKYFEEDKDVDGAKELCKMLMKINCLDAKACESLIRSCIAAGVSTTDIRKMMEEGGVEIHHELENLLERVCPP